MFFSKIPTTIFNAYNNTEDVYSILIYCFKKTVSSALLNKKNINIEGIEKLNFDKFFCIPGPSYLKEEFGDIKKHEFIVYAHLCRDAYLNNTGKVKVDFNTIAKETHIKKTLVKTSINTLNRVGLLITDEKDQYFVVEELYYYFTDSEVKEAIDSLDPFKSL
ncbi:hypothetical protein PDN14_13720 [Bacillus cereus group sp. Bc222]|uniref:hypothetical protein n=1 Tax=Bacillus TaxID=1386 RepID=UPI000944BD6D|nr:MULTISPECIES: hypothetical protein [Bacillus cereus group]MDA1818265.1 hypothetical protein [Bacillus cereus]MDA2239533.1 hypothetical protein [Bacillus cereus group sp. Bc222]MDA2586333.1 hypothetical protein [Bacillus cereus group sp. Bc062]USL00863.1 hypothetical protein LIS83_18470 [Bacillus anthracis]